MTSALLNRPGAVARNENDTVAWHYGDPLREQRKLATDGAVVDRGDRDIVTLTGPDRLSWLHSLATQHLEKLAAEQGTEFLLLSPQGRIEHHAGAFDDGTTLWLDTSAGEGEALAQFLLKMRFFAEVEITPVTNDYALLTVTGPEADRFDSPDQLPVPGAKFATGEVPPRPSTIYAGASADGGWRRRTDALGVPTVDILVPRDQLNDTVDSLGVPLAGSWAYETLRIPAQLPVVGVDTDDKSIPHEFPTLLRHAVHLDKGCYRGQETVARVHNLGKPPRQLTLLHLDGTQEQAPAAGSDVVAGERTVGRLGTASRHYEDGMIALALVKRKATENPGAVFDVAGMTAGL